MGKPWDDFMTENALDFRAEFINWFKVNQERYTPEEIIKERDGWPKESPFHRDFLETFIKKRRADLIKYWIEE